MKPEIKRPMTDEEKRVKREEKRLKEEQEKHEERLHRKEMKKNQKEAGGSKTGGIKFNFYTSDEETQESGV